MHRLKVQREPNIDSATLRFSFPEREAVILPIESLQTCLCVGQPDAAPRGAV
jgi:hypothetical protein